jgi:hypothetical protein
MPRSGGDAPRRAPRDPRRPGPGPDPGRDPHRVRRPGQGRVPLAAHGSAHGRPARTPPAPAGVALRAGRRPTCPRRRADGRRRRQRDVATRVPRGRRGLPARPGRTPAGDRHPPSARSAEPALLLPCRPRQGRPRPPARRARSPTTRQGRGPRPRRRGRSGRRSRTRAVRSGSQLPRTHRRRPRPLLPRRPHQPPLPRAAARSTRPVSAEAAAPACPVAPPACAPARPVDPPVAAPSGPGGVSGWAAPPAALPPVAPSPRRSGNQGRRARDSRPPGGRVPAMRRGFPQSIGGGGRERWTGSPGRHRMRRTDRQPLGPRQPGFVRSWRRS